MDSYLSNITNDLREVNKSLNRENIELKEQISNKDSYIKDLEDSILSLKGLLQTEREMEQKLKNDVEVLSARLDEFLALFAEYINDDRELEIELNGDKNLMFGVNIDSNFIANSTLKAIKNYLNILKCTNIQTFVINDFNTQKKSDIILIGEVFADYVRLSNMNLNVNIYGLVEISMPDIINQNAISIKFYGNRDVTQEFNSFRKIYTNMKA
ncbi:MAG: hypothetical protein K2P17_02180 [Helicobacteraceae bacterium]|nr:hypothetical protein [Helicobacteraceae bacterium]